jgi:hypothetical protein
MAGLSVITPQADTAGPGRRRRWPVIASVSLVVVGVVAALTWRVVGQHPAIGAGSFTATGSSAIIVANDGVTDTKYVLHMVPERDYVVYVSVANTGRFPFTVTGLARSQIALFTPISSATFAVTSPTGAVTFTEPFYATATVRPGRQAAVRLVLRANRCWPMSDGAYMVLTNVAVRVRQFGVTTTQRVQLLALPLYLTDDQPVDKLPAACS